MNRVEEKIERRGIYKINNSNHLTVEEHKKKLDVFTYKILEEAEKEELTVRDVEDVIEKLARYIQIADFTIKNNTKFNAPGCYLK